MTLGDESIKIDEIKGVFLEGFASDYEIFVHIHRSENVLGTGGGEPRYVCRVPIDHAQSYPKAFVFAG